MKKHVITKKQLNEKNEYVGNVDLSDFDGASKLAMASKLAVASKLAMASKLGFLFKQNGYRLACVFSRGFVCGASQPQKKLRCAQNFVVAPLLSASSSRPPKKRRPSNDTETR